MLQQLFSKLARRSRETSHSQQVRRTSKTRNLKVENLESRLAFDVSLAAPVEYYETAGGKDHYLDAAGNTYRTGGYFGRVDFDPSVDRADGSDILENELTVYGDYSYVAKFNADGSFDWVRSLRGKAEAVTADRFGNVFVGGSFVGTASIANQTLVSSGGTDAFLAKYSANGQALWARQQGGATVQDSFYRLEADNTGAVFGKIVSGGSVASGPAKPYVQSILKAGSNGTVEWKRDFSTGSSITRALQGGLELDSSGNPVLAGAFEGTVDFDPSSKKRLITSVGTSSGFMLKLSSTGNLVWVSTFVGAFSNGTVGSSNVFRFDIDSSNNIVAYGRYSGKVDFAPGSLVKNLPETDDNYVAKFNSNGQLTWAMSIPLPNADVSLSAYAVKTGRDGSIYLGGYIDVFNPPNYIPTWVDLNPGAGVNLHLASAYNGFVLKLSPTGEYVWSEVLGNTTGEAWFYDLEIDSRNTLHLAGRISQTTVDLDPSETGTSLITNVDSFYKGFFAKWNQA